MNAAILNAEVNTVPAAALAQRNACKAHSDACALAARIAAAHGYASPEYAAASEATDAAYEAVQAATAAYTAAINGRIAENAEGMRRADAVAFSVEEREPVSRDEAARLENVANISGRLAMLFAMPTPKPANLTVSVSVESKSEPGVMRAVRIFPTHAVCDCPGYYWNGSYKNRPEFECRHIKAARAQLAASTPTLSRSA